MGRTKGALNKKTIERMEKEGKGDVVMENKTEVTTKAAKTETASQGKTKIVKTNSEDFNPDEYRQFYEDGTPYLPFGVQLQWFRMKYPNGKIKTFRPDWSPEKEAGTYIATARVYKDVNDAEDCYLSEASAKRGPDTKIVDTEINIDPFTDCQRAALSLALRLAGFWCSLTPREEVPEDTPKEESPKKESSKKESSEKEPSKEVSKKDAVTDASASNTESEKENSKEASKKEPKNPTEETSNEISSVESVSPAPNEESASSEKTSDEKPEETDLEVTEKSEEPKKQEEPEKEETSNENPEKESDVNETSEKVTEKDSKEEPENSTEETSQEESEEEPTPVTEDDLTDKEKEELKELREVHFANGYYDGTIGDLETKKLAGEELGVNLYAYLLNSPMAARRKPKEVAAAKRVAELLHKEWLSEVVE